MQFPYGPPYDICKPACVRVIEGRYAARAREDAAAPAPLVGFTLLYPTWSSMSLKPRYTLNDLYVAPGARRGGVGRALLRASVDHARAAGAAEIFLRTGVANAAAQALYASEGWARVDDFVYYVKKFGADRGDATAAAAAPAAPPAAVRVYRVDAGACAAVAPLFEEYRSWRFPAPEASASYLRARVGAGDAVAFAAAPTGGGVAGFTLLYPTWGSGAMRPRYTLNDLYVAPGARRGGVGRALLRAGVDHARAAGAAEIFLRTGVANAAAQALYASEGWARVDDFVYFVIKL